MKVDTFTTVIIMKVDTFDLHNMKVKTYVPSA